MTNKYKIKTRILGFISFLLTFGPLLVYSIIGLFNAPPAKAVTLGITLITVLIFTLINLIFKHRIRCTTFILLAGIYAALGHITSLIFIMAITTALDEFVVVPLYHKYKNLFTINKEIDKRALSQADGHYVQGLSQADGHYVQGLSQADGHYVQGNKDKRA